MSCARSLGVLALSAAAGCGTVRTGKPWSTKAGPAPPGATAAAVPAPAPDADADGREAALALLERAAASDNALVRANALEAMHHGPRDRLDPLAGRALVDPNRGVRFVAAMTVGRRRLDRLAHLLEPLLRDEAPSVRAAAMYGLKTCGRPVDLTPLASMIVSDDPEVRANAALVLGELGNRSAVPMIRQAIGHGMELVSTPRVRMVNLQMAEALVRLGEAGEIEVIRAALFAPPEQGELTALACMICGRLEDERVAPDLARLAHRSDELRPPAEVRMAATWALAAIDPQRASIDVPLEYVDSPRYQLRHQAAQTLGAIGDPAALPALRALLADPQPLVQIAAAGAILRVGEEATEPA